MLIDTVILLKPSNASEKKVVGRQFGSNVTEARAVQFLNAVFLIVITEFGIVMDGKAIAFSNALLPNSVSCELFSNVNEVNDEQLLNESQPIYVTVLDIIIDCKPEYENVPSSIYVTEFGITMDVKLEQ